MTKTKHVLNVQSRTLTGSANARRLRKQGLIPAVIYSKGAEPETVAVDAGEWEILTRSELNLISLKEGEKTQLVLLQEVQHDFIRNCASHIDFMAVKNDQKITTRVPLHAGHAAPAGIVAGGQLEQNMHEVEIECTPDSLPEHIEADVAPLGLGDQLHVSEIALPEGVKMVTPGELVAFVVTDPNASGDAPAASGATEPEVIGEKAK